jgi:hypothetical protein
VRRGVPDPRRIRWQAGALSGALYTGWACLGNAQAPWEQIVATGLSQFVVSFAATVFLSTVILGLLRGRRSRTAAFTVAGVISAVYAAVLTFVHLAAGTPNLLATVAPIVAIASAYAFWFALKAVAANAAGPEILDWSPPTEARDSRG